MSDYELTEKEIVEAIKFSTGEEVYPEDITRIKGFGIPIYVVDISGSTTFLCRKLRKGITSVKKVKWW